MVIDHHKVLYDGHKLIWSSWADIDIDIDWLIYMLKQV